MYHPYKNGYSLLPQLKKISKEDVFIVTEDRPYYLDQKKVSLNMQKCVLEHDMDEKIYPAVCQFIIDHYPEKLDGPATLSNLAMQIQEDIAIHRLSGGKDWLAATHVCFPGGWNPEEKLGMTFEQIHDPIPGMNLTNSSQLVEASIFHGPFERLVWGVFYDNNLNHHAALPKSHFDPQHPKFFIKIERQVTVGFPEHRCFAFVIRAFFIPDYEVDKQALLKAIQGMTPEQRAYKSVTASFMDFLSDSQNIQVVV